MPVPNARLATDPGPTALVDELLWLPVDNVLAPLAAEMLSKRWPLEFQAAMWKAVSDEAKRRADETGVGEIAK